MSVAPNGFQFEINGVCCDESGIGLLPGTVCGGRWTAAGSACPGKAGQMITTPENARCVLGFLVLQPRFFIMLRFTTPKAWCSGKAGTPCAVGVTGGCGAAGERVATPCLSPAIISTLPQRASTVPGPAKPFGKNVAQRSPTRRFCSPGGSFPYPLRKNAHRAKKAPNPPRKRTAAFWRHISYSTRFFQC